MRPVPGESTGTAPVVSPQHPYDQLCPGTGRDWTQTQMPLLSFCPWWEITQKKHLSLASLNTRKDLCPSGAKEHF